MLDIANATTSRASKRYTFLMFILSEE